MMRPGGENALAVRNAKSARAHKTHSLDAKEREVTFLRREVERVTAERDALQLSSNGDKAYIRRLEHKMTSSGETSAAERCAQLRARVAKLKEELASATSDAQEHKKQLDASTRDKASLAHALELRAADLSSEAGEDVPSRLLYAVAKGREESVSLAVQLAEKSDALERAMRALEQMRERVERAERGEKDAVQDAAAAAANAADADARAAALEDECGNLTAQIEAFAVVNARLQEAASSAQSRADAQAAKTSNLQAQILTLESSTRVGREARAAGETDLKARLRNALEELASVIAERDETRLALRETLAKCASAMARSERAETAERAARAAVESLERGKRLLQETMAGQLEAVRAQLGRQREQNGALEAAVRRRDADAERLREMVQTEGIGKPGKGSE